MPQMDVALVAAVLGSHAFLLGEYKDVVLFKSKQAINWDCVTAGPYAGFLEENTTVHVAHDVQRPSANKGAIFLTFKVWELFILSCT